MIVLEKKSLWASEIKINNYSKLEEDIEVDVLIIGAGITGVSVAYHLKDSNLRVCIVDRRNIGSGVSSKTTGKLTYLQGQIYSKIEDYYSYEIAKKYYESQKDAIKLVENIVKNNNIDCDYITQKSYLFSSNKKDNYKMVNEKKLLEKMNVNFNSIKRLPINLYNYYGISVSDTAYFHPVKYINELAKISYNSGVSIYENTNIIKCVEKDDKYICYTENNKITSKSVVVACHYPFFLIPYFFPLKGHLEQSYISASKTKDNKNVSGINVSNNSKSFRYYSNSKNNYLIYLNNSHNLANKFDLKDNFGYLFKDLKKINLVPHYIWSNVDIITNDYLPYIGKIKENFYIGSGYNTWGMTNGSLSGLIISDLILGNKNKYINLFNPNRKIFFSSVLYDLYSSAKPFIQNKLIKNKSFYSKNVIFAEKNGENIAIYIDENGKEHIVYNKCPHLKCSLIFNEVELTWDCPCHSSRFDIDGVCIKGPSNYNISYKK